MRFETTRQSWGGELMEPNRPKLSWTPWEQETLIRLVREGLTSAQISARLDRTRNAVIGRCHRLGLVLGNRATSVQVRGKPPKVSIWTPEAVDLLRSLAAQGLTATAMLPYFPQASLSALCSACVRRGISTGTAQGRGVSTGKPGVQKGTPSAARILERIRTAPPPKPIAPPVPVVVAAPVDAKELLALKTSECLYPVSNGLFCAAPKRKNSSYCAHHHAVCWRPAPTHTRLKASDPTAKAGPRFSLHGVAA